MKKYINIKISILIIGFVLWLSTPTEAQYNPMLGSYNEWYVFVDQVGEGGITAWGFTYGDSLINGEIYKRISGVSNGFIREDTNIQKVFYIPYGETDETCIYDFSLSINDSIFLDFNTSFYSFQSGNYYVDTTYMCFFGTDSLKKIILSNPDNIYDLKLIWIESIGSLFGPTYLINNTLEYWTFYTCTDYNYDLVCAYKDSTKIYENTCWQAPDLIGECDVAVLDIEEIADENIEFYIYPNPSSEIFTIKLTNSTNVPNTISIYNTTGKLFQSFNTSRKCFQIDLTSNESGVYILEIANDLNQSLHRLLLIN